MTTRGQAPQSAKLLFAKSTFIFSARGPRGWALLLATALPVTWGGEGKEKETQSSGRLGWEKPAKASSQDPP